jgi:hypothetical protein
MVLGSWGERGSWQGHEWTGRSAVSDAVTRAPGDAVVSRPASLWHLRHVPGRPAVAVRHPTPRHLAGERGVRHLRGYRGRRALPPAASSPGATLASRWPSRCTAHTIGHPARLGALVLGAGPIGALTIAALRAMGVDDVACAEPAEPRRALARAVGAAAVGHPADLVVPTVAEPGLVVEGAVDVALECSGTAAAMRRAWPSWCGRHAVLVGTGMEPPRLNRTASCSTSWSSLVFTYDQGGVEQALDSSFRGVLSTNCSSRRSSP